MKKIFSTLSIVVSTLAFSQINLPILPNLNITGENAFMDASVYSSQFGWGVSESKGLAFPQTDLTQFQFKTDAVNPGILATWFDGMVVYNTATGNTNATPSLGGIQTAVVPGFYYFSNPNGEANGNIDSGQWKPLGAATGNFWSIGGNTGVTAANAKIGTTDNVPVQMISNGNVIQTFGTSSSDVAFKKLIINPNASANTTMAKSKTIGGTAFDFALEVGGKGWFENGIVTSASTYPDYVFDHYFTGKSTVNPTYQFKSLAETEKFIKENNHLPGVTKIDDLAKGGNGYMIDATQLSIQSLEKIEELYLHTIKQQNEIDALKAELAELKALLKK